MRAPILGLRRSCQFLDSFRIATFALEPYGCASYWKPLFSDKVGRAQFSLRSERWLVSVPCTLLLRTVRRQRDDGEELRANAKE